MKRLYEGALRGASFQRMLPREALGRARNHGHFNFLILDGGTLGGGLLILRSGHQNTLILILRSTYLTDLPDLTDLADFVDLTDFTDLIG